MTPRNEKIAGSRIRSFPQSRESPGRDHRCANLRTKIAFDGPVLNFEIVVTRTCLENDCGFAFLPSVNLKGDVS